MLVAGVRCAAQPCAGASKLTSTHPCQSCPGRARADSASERALGTAVHSPLADSTSSRLGRFVARRGSESKARGATASGAEECIADQKRGAGAHPAGARRVAAAPLARPVERSTTASRRHGATTPAASQSQRPRPRARAHPSASRVRAHARVRNVRSSLAVAQWPREWRTATGPPPWYTMRSPGRSSRRSASAAASTLRPGPHSAHASPPRAPVRRLLLQSPRPLPGCPSASDAPCRAALACVAPPTAAPSSSGGAAGGDTGGGGGRASTRRRMPGFVEAGGREGGSALNGMRV